MQFAVPMLVFVEATDITHAYMVAHEKVQMPMKEKGVFALLDERLDAFSFNPLKHGVHSALDKDEVQS